MPTLFRTTYFLRHNLCGMSTCWSSILRIQRSEYFRKYVEVALGVPSEEVEKRGYSIRIYELKKQEAGFSSRVSTQLKKCREHWF
jgi:hypothetical protein